MITVRVVRDFIFINDMAFTHLLDPVAAELMDRGSRVVVPEFDDDLASSDWSLQIDHIVSQIDGVRDDCFVAMSASGKLLPTIVARSHATNASMVFFNADLPSGLIESDDPDFADLETVRSMIRSAIDDNQFAGTGPGGIDIPEADIALMNQSMQELTAYVLGHSDETFSVSELTTILKKVPIAMLEMVAPVLEASFETDFGDQIPLVHPWPTSANAYISIGDISESDAAFFRNHHWPYFQLNDLFNVTAVADAIIEADLVSRAGLE